MNGAGDAKTPAAGGGGWEGRGTVGKLKQGLAGLMKSPWLWGGAATTGFYGLIHEYQLGGALASRYFAGHWVEYVSTAMFFVGLAVLVVKMLGVFRQMSAIERLTLGKIPRGGQDADESELLLDKLAAWPQSWRNSYLGNRLLLGLEHVRRTGTAEQLEDELKYLSDMDATRLHGSFGLVRLLIGAMPLMGFLGTVIGITLAIADISPQQLIENPQSVTSGLSVAFDTTALAIALSIALLLAQYLADSWDHWLMEIVDQRTTRELSGRFRINQADRDPSLAVVQKMSEEVVQATQQLVERQVTLWQTSMQESAQQWKQLATLQQQVLEQSLTNSLASSLELHAQHMRATEESLAEQNRLHWGQVQQALEATTSAITKQHEELSKQSETLLQVVEGTEQIVRLEDGLNRNLHALGQADSFQEMLVSLNAAINLLTARIGSTEGERPAIQLKRPAKEGRVA